jgi:putative transposase
VAETWGEKYTIPVRSWENNWHDLATMFHYTPEIRRLIYPTNLIEGSHRQLRQVTKNRAAFPSPEAARKLLWLAQRDIAKKWTMPIPHWAIILYQLAVLKTVFQFDTTRRLHKMLTLLAKSKIQSSES